MLKGTFRRTPSSMISSLIDLIIYDQLVLKKKKSSEIYFASVFLRTISDNFVAFIWEITSWGYACSYQNLSPSLKLAKVSPIIFAPSSPIIPPSSGFSAKMPTHKSKSSGPKYVFRRFMMVSISLTATISSKLRTILSPYDLRTWLYPERPWSRLLCRFKLNKSSFMFRLSGLRTNKFLTSSITFTLLSFITLYCKPLSISEMRVEETILGLKNNSPSLCRW